MFALFVICCVLDSLCSVLIIALLMKGQKLMDWTNLCLFNSGVLMSIVSTFMLVAYDMNPFSVALSALSFAVDTIVLLRSSAVQSRGE